MEKIIIDNKPIELYFNVAAMNSIADRCGGDIGDLGEKLNECTSMESINLICGIICDLANGAVTKHNCEIALGLETGEKRKKYDEDYFKAVMTPAAMAESVGVILNVMNIGSEFEVPDNLNIPETDIDLAEIEAEKNKEKKS